ALAIIRDSPSSAASGEFEGVRIRSGTAEDLGVTESDAARARASRAPIRLNVSDDWPSLIQWDESQGVFLMASGRATNARREMARLYALVVISLLVFYFMIALALEVFVLPRNVWRPIARLREADAAVQMGR